MAELEQLGLRSVPRRNTSYHFAFGFIGDVPLWLSFQRLSDGSLDRVSRDCARDDATRALPLLESKRKRPTPKR